MYASLAQSVEHAAVNRGVVGSSPTGGAILSIRLVFPISIEVMETGNGPLAQLVRAPGS